MESLFKVVRKSPRPFSRSKEAKSRHKKLGENWGGDKQPVKEGVTFHVKFLGSTLVEELDDGQSYGDQISSVAVKTIVNMAKVSGKKLVKMAITVCTSGIKVVNQVTKEIKTNMSIYRICFCTADRTHDKVFAYIARNTENETMECHAFLCSKRKIAQAVTLTVAQAFSVAQEEWDEKEQKDMENNQKRAELSETQTTTTAKNTSPTEDHVGNIINFDDSSPMEMPHSQSNTIFEFLDHKKPPPSQDTTLGFEDDFNVEDDFSSLAKSRSSNHPSHRPPLPQQQQQRINPFSNFSMGLRPEDIEDGIDVWLNGECSGDELTRQPSIDDLLSL